MLKVGDRVKVNAHGAGRVWLRSNGTNASLQEGSEHVVAAVDVVKSMCVIALDAPHTPVWPESFFDPVKPDWRVGLSVRTRSLRDFYFAHQGEVLEVLPSGSFGFSDEDGVLIVRLVCCCEVVIAPACRWVTVDKGNRGCQQLKGLLGTRW